MEIIENADITEYSTLRVQASAEKLIKAATIDELVLLFKEIKAKNLSWNILGAGSNSLLSSKPLKGITIYMPSLNFIKKLSDTCFHLGAGVKMPRFCAEAAKESLAGAEFMEGIPGTIGGAIVMNAGAHGSEIADILKSAQVLDLDTLELKEFSAEDFNFTYRRSNINPDKHLILSAFIELVPGEKSEIRAKISANNQARTNHQPIKAWTCGCTFKNPTDNISAGRLIDSIGAKGLSEGAFTVSNKHANFFENSGAASSEDFCRLMAKVQDLAYAETGVLLYPEVKPMGEFSEEEKLIWQPELRFAVKS